MKSTDLKELDQSYPKVIWFDKLKLTIRNDPEVAYLTLTTVMPDSTQVVGRFMTSNEHLRQLGEVINQIFDKDSSQSGKKVKVE